MKCLVARTSAEINSAYDKLASSNLIGCDTETSSLSARTGKLFSVQFSDGETNVLVPVSERVALGQLAELLSDSTIIKVFHNAKFDLNFLWENGYQTDNVFCTMIAEKVLTKGANQSVSLAETLYRYFAVDLDKSQRGKFHRNWDGIWTNELVDYAISDVVFLPRLMKEQNNWLEKLGLKEELRLQMSKIFIQPD